MVTIKTSLIAQGLIILFGTPDRVPDRNATLPWTVARDHARGTSARAAPAVAGIGLLAAFGRSGLLGSTFDALGFSIPFTQVAVVMAVAFVASPLYITPAIAAFQSVDPNIVAASRTLGAGPGRTFFRVVLPLARAGLPPASRSRSPAVSASSERRSCSPAASRA